MVCRGSTPHFIPSDVRGDMLVERRQLPVAPVLMEDVELQRVALDFEVVQCRHGVRVVAGPTDHTAELVADFLNDEVLLGRACAKAQPDPDHVLPGQPRLPWSGLNIARCRRSHALAD